MEELTLIFWQNYCIEKLISRFNEINKRDPQNSDVARFNIIFVFFCGLMGIMTGLLFLLWHDSWRDLKGLSGPVLFEIMLSINPSLGFILAFQTQRTRAVPTPARSKTASERAHPAPTVQRSPITAIQTMSSTAARVVSADSAAIGAATSRTASKTSSGHLDLRLRSHHRSTRKVSARPQRLGLATVTRSRVSYEETSSII